MKVSKKKKYYEIDLSINKSGFIGLILAIFALVLNLVYFSANSGLWWDEAEYLGFVNHIVKGSPYSLWEGRAIFYPLMLSVLGFINSSEAFLRVGLIIFSCVTVYFTFQVLNHLFKEKVAILATLLFISNGLFNFFSIRFLTGIPSLMFTMIGLHFFFKKSYKDKFLSGLFFGCAIATRFTSVFIIPALFVHELLSKREVKSFIWVPALLIGFVPTMLFDLFSGELPWTTLITFLTQSTAERTWGRNLGEWYYYLYNSPSIISVTQPLLLIAWIVLFLLGLIVFFSWLKTSKRNKIILVSIFVILYFLSYSFLTPLKEDRYMIPILPFIFSIFVLGIVSVSNTIGKFFRKLIKVKNINYFLVIGFVILLVLNSLSLGRSMILSSADTFSELRYAGESIKANTPSTDKVMTNAGPHLAYHAERGVVGFPATYEELNNTLKSNPDINILVFSFYETVPDYLTDFYNNTNFFILEEYTRGDASIVITLGYLRE